VEKLPCISRTHTASIGEYLHLRYLKCLHIIWVSWLPVLMAPNHQSTWIRSLNQTCSGIKSVNIGVEKNNLKSQIMCIQKYIKCYSSKILRTCIISITFPCEFQVQKVETYCWRNPARKPTWAGAKTLYNSGINYLSLNWFFWLDFWLPSTVASTSPTSQLRMTTPLWGQGRLWNKPFWYSMKYWSAS